uniref:UDP-glucuronosyltransferase n=1 Tax=Panagrolaimus sp. JU765 TaxID=591449 RepID=A0AC34R5A8_9BILA
MAHDVGVPSPPSYVPLEMADAGDRMGFKKRFINVILRALMPIFNSKSLAGPETELFRKFVHPKFPDLRDLAQNCPLVMVNTHELYDFPRPTLGKIINIGGLGMVQKSAPEIKDPYKSKLEKYDSAILFSLGTVANASLMSQQWKHEILNTFASFPSTLFIFRYIGDDLDSKISANVVLNKWLPQNDLLHHPKVKLFITQCGYNSLQEAIHAAKPIIAIPLFGDQKRNANLARKHGFGLILSKSEFSADKLSTSIRLVLTDKNLTESVQKLSKKVINRPFSAEETLIKWTEFLAENKDLSQMNPAGNELSFVEYHNLDVFWCLGFIFVAFAWILFKIIDFLTNAFCIKKQDQEKNKQE